MNNILDDSNFKLFSEFIYNKSGIRFSDSNRIVLDSRLKDIMREKKELTLSEYYKLINSDMEEYMALLDKVTTNLTSFFRNDGHFWELENFVLPDLIKQKFTKKDYIIKVWSAGCSTGEEPYSIAMLLETMLPPPITYKILASDISLKSLEVARSGIYKENRIDKIPKVFQDKYLEKVGDDYKIKDIIKKKVFFDYHNIINEIDTKDFDLVFCRNLLIYFDEDSFKKVVNIIYNSMKRYSYFFIGHSESLFKLKTNFKFVKGERACFYKKSEE